MSEKNLAYLTERMICCMYQGPRPGPRCLEIGMGVVLNTIHISFHLFAIPDMHNCTSAH